MDDMRTTLERMRARFRYPFRPKASRWFLLLASSVFVVLIVLYAMGMTPFPAWSFWAASVPLAFFAFLYPSEGMKLIVMMLPLEAVVFDSGLFDAQFRLYQILSVGVGTGYAQLFFSQTKTSRRFRLLWIDWVVILLCMVVLAGAVVNGGGMPDLKIAVVFLFCVLLYGVSRVSIRSLSDIRGWMPYIVGPVFFSSVFVIVQSFLFEKGWLANHVMDARPHGTFPEADWLGGFLALGVACLVAALFGLRRGGIIERNVLLGRFLVVECLLFAFIALVLTVSRSAWVAGAAAVAIFALSLIFCFGPRRAASQLGSSFNYLGLLAALLFFATGIISVLGLSRFDFGNRLGSAVTGEQKITIACRDAAQIPSSIGSVDDLAARGCLHIGLEERELYVEKGYVIGSTVRPDPNTGIRMRIWSQAVSLIGDNPLTGIGWNAAGKELGTDGRGTPLNASNLWLEFALTSGLATAVLVTILFGYIVWRSAAVILVAPSSDIPWAVLMTFGAVFVFNMFNAGTLLGYLWVWLGAVVSMLAFGTEKTVRREDDIVISRI